MPTQPRKTILLATDHSGSVLNAVDTIKLSTIAYTPYGDSSVGDDPRGQLRFNGELQEFVTGYYPLGNGYRMYSPRLMRFLSPDSWSPFEAGWLNAYAYCAGDPRNRYDSNGHSFRSFFNFFKILRQKLKSPGKAPDELIRTPVSMRSGTGSAYDSVGSSTSKGGFSSNYESIKSYSSVETTPSVPMRSPPQSISQNSISSIGPSASLRKRNPLFVEIHGVTINRNAHGSVKPSISQWAKSTHNIPDEQLEAFTQIPRAGAKLHTEQRLAVQINGVRRGTVLQLRANKNLRAADFGKWVKE